MSFDAATTIPISEKTARSIERKNRSSKWKNRGGFFLILLALIVITLKENAVSLDQFLVAHADEHSRSSSSVTNSTLLLEDFFQLQHASPLLVTKQSLSFPPLSCSDIFYEDRNQPRPFGDPNKGGMYARYTKTHPPFWISLHDQNFDPTRWSVMKYGYYYESHESESFTSIIRAFAREQRKKQEQQHYSSLEPIRVIDVGGNIGWYTLLVIAAAMEQKFQIIVDVFEPNPRNHRRLCESLFLNEWIRNAQIAVNLYPVGVTSSLMANRSATGRLDVETSGEGSLAAMGRKNISGTATFPLVTLDKMSNELGWTDANQPVSILKVDVEGFELEVFDGAQRLLKSKTIQNVFFEGNIRTEQERDRFKRTVRLLLSNGYVAYKIGGFRGADTIVKGNLNLNTTSAAAAVVKNRIDKYVSDLLKECEQDPQRRKRLQCNMWWRP